MSKKLSLKKDSLNQQDRFLVKDPAPRAQGVKIQIDILWLARSSRAMTQMRTQFIPVPGVQGVLAFSLNLEKG